MNPSCEDIYNAVCNVNARNIFILPNNKNIIMTANQVADMCEDNIVVIPTRSVPQGISAMIGFDESASWEDNRDAMCESYAAVDTVQITYAARNSNFDGMDIKEGDYLSLLNDKLLKNDRSISSIVESVAEKIKESGKSMVSIYYGEDVSEGDAEATQALFAELLGDSVEINLYFGGQPVYYYVISIE